MKPHFRLRVVKTKERPLAPLSRAEKLAQAKAYLQRRRPLAPLGLYILTKGTPKPSWGLPNYLPPVLNAALAHSIMEADRRRRK